MSDHVVGLTVFFEKPVSEESAANLCQIFQVVGNVSRIEPKLWTADESIGEVRGRSEVLRKLSDWLSEQWKT